jgi:Arc/MetJ-type ribon-helix-helix transcriptional regulator
MVIPGPAQTASWLREAEQALATASGVSEWPQNRRLNMGRSFQDLAFYLTGFRSKRPGLKLIGWWNRARAAVAGAAWTTGTRYPKVEVRGEGAPQMTIEIRQPELKRLMQEEILSGHFQSMDELLTEALQALREKNAPPPPASRVRKNLAQFLLESPFAGSDLNLERQQDYGRPIEL